MFTCAHAPPARGQWGAPATRQNFLIKIVEDGKFEV